MNRIPIATTKLDGNEGKYLKECIDSGWISSTGPFVNSFEKKFSEYCGTKYGVSVANGTVALHLAMVTLGIKKGDEVLVPALTFIASASTVKHCGAKPVFVDVDPKTWNIDPSKIENYITSKTKAIMPVHLYGNPCDMNKIKKIADKNNLYIIEDAAEAHGAKFNKKRVGSFSDISCFSFYANKTITTGEGGMCLTDNPDLDEKMRVLRDHGMSKKRRYWHEVVGFNYRMTNLQAAVGVAQLERIDEFLKAKKLIGNYYRKKLAGLNGVHFQEQYPSARSIDWLVSIMFDEEFGYDRDKIISHLNEAEIDTRPVFYPIPAMPPYKTNLRFPVSERISKFGISLPSSPNLTRDNVEYICNQIISLAKKD